MPGAGREGKGVTVSNRWSSDVMRLFPRSQGSDLCLSALGLCSDVTPTLSSLTLHLVAHSCTVPAVTC